MDGRSRLLEQSKKSLNLLREHWEVAACPGPFLQDTLSESQQVRSAKPNTKFS